MPAIKRVNVATSSDALQGLNFKVQGRPFLCSLFASGVTAGDVISMSVGASQIVVSAQTNIEASADVVDTDRDQILFREFCPAGEIFLPITATTAVNFLLVIEPIPT